MKKLLLVFLILGINAHLMAQSNCNCCTPNHRAFDFWAGDWEVFDSTGTKVGENLIYKVERNCVLNEHWTSVRGGTGRSYNYYDPADSTWNQIWLDSWGSNLVLKGKPEGNKMILKSELLPGEKIDWYANRITWTSNEDGSVTQTWDVLDKNDKIISVAFKGIYKRRPASFGDEDKTAGIKKITEDIYVNAKKSKSLKTTDGFTADAADSTEMTIYTEVGIVSRIVKSSAKEDGMLTIEWFYLEGEPVYAYETFEFKESNNEKAIWKNFKGNWAWESRFYFVDGELVYHNHSGRTEMEESVNGNTLLNNGKNLFTIASMFK